eukprot:1191073-Rhodomonas_salina.3
MASDGTNVASRAMCGTEIASCGTGIPSLIECTALILWYWPSCTICGTNIAYAQALSFSLGTMRSYPPTTILRDVQYQHSV